MNVANLFKEYKNYAFRFETFPIYKVSGEWEDYEHYLKTGECKQNSDLVDFINDIEKMISNNRRHIRTRVLPLECNPYFKFETQIGYIPQNRIGVELNFITVSDYKKIDNPYDLLDFWLFDDSILLLMNYSNEGEFISTQICQDQNVIDSAIKMKTESYSFSKTLSYVLETYKK